MISEYVDNYIPLIDYVELERFFPYGEVLQVRKTANLRQFIEDSTEKVAERMMKRIRF